MIPGDEAVYEGSKVLANKFNIKDPEIARALEYKFASVRALELAVTPIQGNFDFAHLQAIHGHLFGDMYDWAGKTRNVDFAKRSTVTGRVSRFTHSVLMEFEIEDFNKFIRDNNQLKGLNKGEFVKAFTQAQTMLNKIHPFREGNGRSIRIFLAQLAREAGYKFDVEKIDKEQWNLASHLAMEQFDAANEKPEVQADPASMEKIMAAAVQPAPDRVFLQESKENALALYPELKDAYTQLEAIKEHVANHPERDKLVAITQRRLADKIGNGSLAQEREEAAALLEQAKASTKLSQPAPGLTSEYELAASVIEDVLKSRGTNPETQEKLMAEAIRKLESMQNKRKAADKTPHHQQPTSQKKSPAPRREDGLER